VRDQAVSVEHQDAAGVQGEFRGFELSSADAEGQASGQVEEADSARGRDERGRRMSGARDDAAPGLGVEQRVDTGGADFGAHLCDHGVELGEYFDRREVESREGAGHRADLAHQRGGVDVVPGDVSDD
jgi:hypothetical protein